MFRNSCLKISILLSLFLFHACFWGVKKNLDQLKNCKFEITNLLVHTERNREQLLIPKVVVTPIVSVTNPNEEDVEIYQFNLRVFLLTQSGRQQIGTVINEEPKLIPKMGQMEFPLNLDLEQNKGIDAKFISLLLQLVSAAAKGEEAELFIDGTMQIHTTVGNLSLPVSETRRIKLQR